MEHAHRWVHTTRMPVRWGDMDAMGHVNNTVYFRYMEQARIEWLELCHYGIDRAQDEAAVIVKPFNIAEIDRVIGELARRNAV